MRAPSQGAQGVIFTAMKKPPILAVDDVPELLALMARALSDDYDVRTAASGAQALLAAAADPAKAAAPKKPPAAAPKI